MPKSALNLALSATWGLASASARKAADLGLLRRVRLDVPRVVSVGNLQAGGAGKTPLVAQIAIEAAARGLRVCILSRGYGGSWEKSGGWIAPGAAKVSPSDCGDEPALLHSLAPDAWIAVSRDRVGQFRSTALNRKFELVILDDGFQHWKVHRDVEILALTSATPAERPFRDFQSAAQRADLLVWTKGEAAPPAFGKPLVKVRMKLQAVSGGSEVLLVAGVADPRAVSASAREAGYQIRREAFFRDHAPYAEAQVRALLAEARARGWRVALTGKDWVKWHELGVSREEVIVLEPRIAFESGQELWDRVLWGS